MNKVTTSLRYIGLGIADIIAPRYCMVCAGHLSDVEHHICNLCRASLPETNFHRKADNPVKQRFAGYTEIEQATALFYYVRHTPLADAIHAFKYRRFPSLAVEFGKEMGKRLFPSGFLSDIDMLIPVPIHFIKRLSRGYNQSERLAAGLGKNCNLPVRTNLYARRNHSTQTGLTPEERIHNIAGVFGVHRPEELHGKHILLIDDVCTTGSTLLACAQTLRQAVEDIRCSVATLATTPTI